MFSRIQRVSSSKKTSQTNKIRGFRSFEGQINSFRMPHLPSAHMLCIPGLKDWKRKILKYLELSIFYSSYTSYSCNNFNYKYYWLIELFFASVPDASKNSTRLKKGQKPLKNNQIISQSKSTTLYKLIYSNQTGIRGPCVKFLMYHPGVNFINIIRTNFSYDNHFSSYVLVLLKNLYEKHASIMLMKLTTGHIIGRKKSID